MASKRRARTRNPVRRTERRNPMSNTGLFIAAAAAAGLFLLSRRAKAAIPSNGVRVPSQFSIPSQVSPPEAGPVPLTEEEARFALENRRLEEIGIAAPIISVEQIDLENRITDSRAENVNIFQDLVEAQNAPEIMGVDQFLIIELEDTVGRLTMEVLTLQDAHIQAAGVANRLIEELVMAEDSDNFVLAEELRPQANEAMLVFLRLKAEFEEANVQLIKAETLLERTKSGFEFRDIPL